jgi:hypothetical protein
MLQLSEVILLHIYAAVSQYAGPYSFLWASFGVHVTDVSGSRLVPGPTAAKDQARKALGDDRSAVE